MNDLASCIDSLPVSRRQLARQLDISASLLSRIVRHGVWPRCDADALRDKLARTLAAYGITPDICEQVLNKTPQTAQEKDKMIMQRQILTAQASQLFGLPPRLFGDLADDTELYLTSGLYTDLETIYQAAWQGGLLAVVGESGAGKTTLVQAVQARFLAEGKKVTFIRPYVIGMEDTNRTGNILKAKHIAESIIMALEPGMTIPASPQRLYARVEKALSASYAAGNRHALIIEEAHSLNLSTVRHLKRFHEQRLGFKHLLGIILVGQPELANKLSENIALVREVVQRCEVLTIKPLADAEGYVRHRLQRVGVEFDSVFAPDALPAVQQLMADPRHGGNALYPLAIGNVLIRAINIAAKIGVTRVTADVIRKVR